jgi:hypothetical protein
MRAVEKVSGAGMNSGAGMKAPDVGGSATTRQVTDAVADAIRGSKV